MTNRGLFALFATTSVLIDTIMELSMDHSRETVIAMAILVAVCALCIFGTVRGYKVAFAGIAAYFAISVLTSVVDFLPIEALRAVLEPASTLPLKLVNLATLMMLSAAIVAYFRPQTVRAAT